MPNDWAHLTDDAERLAAWTTLSADAFGTAYTLSHAGGTADAWRALETRLPEAGSTILPRDALILAACREAAAKGFIDALAMAVARLESEGGRSGKDVGDLLETMGATGIMQAMTDRAKSLIDASVFRALADASDGCACVKLDGQPRGTGFLVGPDLVMTAAHVVLKHAPDASGVEAWSDTLWPGLTFSFKPPASDPKGDRFDVPAAGEAAVVYAQPYGTPPNNLEMSLVGPLPAERLDFALVRLARQVSHLTPINIREPAKVTDNVDRLCFVMGFTGGTKIMFDADKVSRFDEPSGRVFHRANTIAGMSGGCCVGVEGTVIALHEGAVPVLGPDGLPKPDQFDNRGIALSMVRARQRASGRDPLDERPRAPGVMLTDPLLTGELLRAGLRLAGPALAPLWEQTAAAMGLTMTPAPTAEIIATHPWFKRAAFETWVDRATEQDQDRVAFVTGGRGAGKSFCATILAAKIRDPLIDLIKLTPTQTGAWAWQDAISPFLGRIEVEARAAAGAIRYDDVPALIGRLEQRGGKLRTRSTPLFVAIDFGNGEGFRSADAGFTGFIEGLAAEEWARLVLIGLSADERDDLSDLLAAHQVTPTETEMSAIGENELKAFLITLAAGRGKTLGAAEARARVKTVWSPETNLSAHQPDLQTAEAALCAIALARDSAA